MLKKITVIVLTIFFASTKGQELTLIKGYVKTDSLYVKGVHVINKTNQLATYSNNDGFFTIRAKRGDVILFSSVSFLNRKIQITDTHINSKSMLVYLEPEVYELSEVTLSSFSLNYSVSDLRKKNYNANYSESPNIRSVVDPTYAPGTSGVDLIAVASLIVRPFFKKYRQRKEEKQRMLAHQNRFVNQIRAVYDDSFFIDTLHIPKEKINLFIEYCEEKGLQHFYEKSDIETVDFFIKKAKTYCSLLEKK